MTLAFVTFLGRFVLLFHLYAKQKFYLPSAHNKKARSAQLSDA
jgi:hypothetical protein